MIIFLIRVVVLSVFKLSVFLCLHPCGRICYYRLVVDCILLVFHVLFSPLSTCGVWTYGSIGCPLYFLCWVFEVLGILENAFLVCNLGKLVVNSAFVREKAEVRYIYLVPLELVSKFVFDFLGLSLLLGFRFHYGFFT